MALESAADRLAFVAPGEFGVDATYLPSGGGSVALTGLFDTDFSLVSLGDGAPIADNALAFTYPTAQHATPARGDRLSIDMAAVPFGASNGVLTGTVSFHVRDIHANPPNAGAGFTALILEAP